MLVFSRCVCSKWVYKKCPHVGHSGQDIATFGCVVVFGVCLLVFFFIFLGVVVLF